jgi:hypothetical protein
MDLFDLRTPWCAYVAATLRIPQRVAGGVTRVEDLAREAGCDERALHGLLSHLVGKGVFEEPERGVFALNEAAQQLTGPFLDLGGIGGRMAHAWSTLETYVRTGRPAYAERFGRPWWDDLAAHPALGAEFDELMGVAGHGAPDPWFELTDGWDGVHWVVDVGGGTGAMLRELLAARPGLRGTLVDLPGTVARAEGDFERVGQSFFDPLPAGADLYLLRSVLNDWPDAETDAILTRVGEAAGRVVIFGGVAPDEAPARLDIEMLLLGGRTDSLSAFRERAARAGLTVVADGRQADGRYYVECAS